MGLPGKKTPSSQTKTRRSHMALSKGTLTTCAKCKSPVRPHHVCPKCGTYRGRAVVDMMTKKEKAKLKTKKSSKPTEKKKESKDVKKEAK